MVSTSCAQRVFKIPLVQRAFASTLKGINTLRYPGSEVPLQRKQRKGTSGRRQRGYSNDRTNQIIAFHWWNLRLIGRSDEHRTQTTLKRAGCFDDKKYLRCATLVNQVHTWIVSKKFRHEEQPQDTPNNNVQYSSMERSLKLLNYALVVSTDVQW